jgi:thiamine pyrophosphate-dependent acetolactate synthase large subunit-like protein
VKIVVFNNYGLGFIELDETCFPDFGTKLLGLDRTQTEATAQARSCRVSTPQILMLS